MYSNFPVCKTNTLMIISSNNDSLINYISKDIVIPLYYHEQYKWYSKCYTHRFNIKNNRHEIDIKNGSASIFYIDDILLNDFDLISNTSYIMRCKVNYDILNDKNYDIFHINAIYYNDILDIPNTLWSSMEYYNGDITIILVSYLCSIYRKYIFVGYNIKTLQKN